MKRHRSAKPGKPQIKLWTHAEVVKALPYVCSILRSLRENALQTNAVQRRLERLDEKPGRLSRTELIAQAELRRDARERYDGYLNDLDELQELGVGCVDPLQGEAIFPFLYDDQVAWFTYDLFEGPQLRWWRYDSDSPTTRRPIYTDMKGQSRPVGA